MTVPVHYLPPGDQWDQTLVRLLLTNRLYPTGWEFAATEGDVWPDAEGLVLVFPGRYYVDRSEEIHDALSRYRWALIIKTGDEEDAFDIAPLAADPRRRVWIQTPRIDRTHPEGVRFMPLGFSPHFVDLPADPPDKTTTVFLSAQKNHDRRRQAFDALAGREDDEMFVRPTPGFTQGLAPEVYRDHMLAARIALAPSGVVSPCSFRLFEALEAHAVPIADDVSPVYDSRGYWSKLLPGAPMPVISDYGSLVGWVDDLLQAYPANANQIAAWWFREKRRWAFNLDEDLGAVTADAL
jgi:hypothetical protein